MADIRLSAGMMYLRGVGEGESVIAHQKCLLLTSFPCMKPRKPGI